MRVMVIVLFVCVCVCVCVCACYRDKSDIDLAKNYVKIKAIYDFLYQGCNILTNQSTAHKMTKSLIHLVLGVQVIPQAY